jgi:iron-sulfur cluster assembly protein
MTKMNITLTPAALAHVEKMRANQPDAILRLAVKQTGCSGFSYVPVLETEVKADDHVFAQSNGLIVCVDPTSLPYLQGITVDYVREGLSSSFKYINPNATGSCGCGESFTT